MLRIYNTLTGKKEIFEPMNPPAVKMYACGITVSGVPRLAVLQPEYRSQAHP